MKRIFKRAAFSLVEMLIVIMLFAVLVAISVPLFLPENVKFDSWANSLYNTLYRGKMAAIINLYEVGFSIIDNRNFILFIDFNRDGVQSPGDQTIFDSRSIFSDFRNRNCLIQNVTIVRPNGNVDVINSFNNTLIFRFNTLGFVNLPDNTRFTSIILNLANSRVSYRYVINLTSGGSITIAKQRI